MAQRNGMGFCAAALLVSAVLMAGCSKEKLNELVEQGKQKLDEGVQKAKQSVADGTSQAGDSLSQAAGQAQESLGLAGSIEIAGLGLKTNGCYARYVPPSGGRPAVLVIQSYREARSETFPSAFIRAVVPVGSRHELGGQNVPVQVFAQAQANGPVWAGGTVSGEANSESIELRILAVDDKKLVAELTSGQLVNTQGATQPAVGKVEGVWLDAAAASGAKL